MSSKPSVAVFGAGGPSGSLVVDKLLEAKIPTTAVVRNPDKYAERFPKQVHLTSCISSISSPCFRDSVSTCDIEQSFSSSVPPFYQVCHALVSCLLVMVMWTQTFSTWRLWMRAHSCVSSPCYVWWPRKLAQKAGHHLWSAMSGWLNVIVPYLLQQCSLQTELASFFQRKKCW